MSADSLSAAERETTVTVSDDAEHVLIWTAQRRFITRLRKSRAFTQTRTGHYGTTEWAEFTIPADQWNPASGAKRKSSLTDEQKLAAAERLRKAREQ